MTGIYSAASATINDDLRIPASSSTSSSPAQVSCGDIARFISGKVLGLVASDSGSAASNRTIIQAALNSRAVVYIDTPGIYYVDSTLTIGANTSLIGVQGVTLKNTTGKNSSVLKNKNTSSVVDTNIYVSDIIFDGDKSNQTTNFSTVDLAYVEYAKLERCQFNGALRTGTYPSVSSNGEGIVLRHCRYVDVIDCHAKDNTYDGFKTRTSFDCTFTNITATDNGRAGIQISYDISGSPADGSERIVVNGITVNHSSGTPSAAAPSTTGVYFHGASRCTVNNVNVKGTWEGIGLVDSSKYNVISNATLRTVHSTNEASIAFDGLNADGNVISNFTITPLSGESGNYIRFYGDSAYNRVSNGILELGGGTGTWAVDLVASGMSCDWNQVTDIVSISGYSTSDTGSNNTVSIVDAS